MEQENRNLVNTDDDDLLDFLFYFFLHIQCSYPYKLILKTDFG